MHGAGVISDPSTAKQGMCCLVVPRRPIPSDMRAASSNNSARAPSMKSDNTASGSTNEATKESDVPSGGGEVGWTNTDLWSMVRLRDVLGAGGQLTRKEIDRLCPLGGEPRAPLSTVDNRSPAATEAFKYLEGSVDGARGVLVSSITRSVLCILVVPHSTKGGARLNFVISKTNHSGANQTARSNTGQR